MTLKKIRFVTDSTCDLPPTSSRNTASASMPTFVNYGDRSYADDGVELTRDDFYRQLPDIEPFPDDFRPAARAWRKKSSRELLTTQTICS